MGYDMWAVNGYWRYEFVNYGELDMIRVLLMTKWQKSQMVLPNSRLSKRMSYGGGTNTGCYIFIMKLEHRWCRSIAVTPVVQWNSLPSGFLGLSACSCNLFFPSVTLVASYECWIIWCIRDWTWHGEDMIVHTSRPMLLALIYTFFILRRERTFNSFTVNKFKLRGGLRYEEDSFISNPAAIDGLAYDDGRNPPQRTNHSLLFHRNHNRYTVSNQERTQKTSYDCGDQKRTTSL